MEHVLLSMQHISKSYPGVQALDDVSLRLDRGQILALAGENGAGKSTLMKILSGSVTPSGGTILLDGEEVSFSNPRQALDAGISIMYQELNYLNDLSIAENIFVGRLPQNGLLNKIDYSRLHKDCSALLERVGLHHDPFTRVRELSVAEKQLVEIAKAISRSIRILIMDEPTSALNEEETKNLFRIIRELAAQKIAIIYISHRMEEIFEISDRVMVMRDGKYVDDLPTAQTTREELIRLMVGRDIGAMFPARNVAIGEPLMKVEHLCVKKIQDVSFCLREGEVLGIFGLMGAGRTELVESIFGVHKITGGSIEIKGKPVVIHSPEEAIRAGIAYVPSERKQDGLILSHSVKNNMTLANLRKYNRGYAIDSAAETAAARGWVDTLDIKTPGLGAAVDTLSGGNQQKVVIAKWLDTAPQILILNEPTRGVDVGAKVEIYNTLELMCKKKIGVILISSELPEIMAIADRIIVIHEGRYMGECLKQDISQERLLSMAIGG